MSLLRSISQEAQSLLLGSTLIEVFLLVLPTNLPCFAYLPSCPNVRVHQAFSLQLQAHGLTQEVAKNLEVLDWNPICKSQADWLRGCSVSASASPPEAPALGVDGSLLLCFSGDTTVFPKPSHRHHGDLTLWWSSEWSSLTLLGLPFFPMGCLTCVCLLPDDCTSPAPTPSCCHRAVFTLRKTGQGLHMHFLSPCCVCFRALSQATIVLERP